MLCGVVLHWALGCLRRHWLLMVCPCHQRVVGDKDVPLFMQLNKLDSKEHFLGMLPAGVSATVVCIEQVGGSSSCPKQPPDGRCPAGVGAACAVFAVPLLSCTGWPPVSCLVVVARAAAPATGWDGAQSRLTALSWRVGYASSGGSRRSVHL